MNTYQRRNSIAYYLKCGNRTTKQKLAYHYNVSIQTIRRDIDFLSDQLPIVTKPGNGGGIFLSQDAAKEIQYLEHEEKECLRRMLEYADSSDKLILETIINKFSPLATS